MPEETDLAPLEGPRDASPPDDGPPTEERQIEARVDDFLARFNVAQDEDTDPARLVPKPVYKPDCSSLASAVEFDTDGRAVAFLAKPGDRVVYEHANHAWWPTERFEVLRIADDGTVVMWSTGMYHAMTNWRTAHLSGHRLMLETPKAKVTFAQTGRRGRPRKEKPPEEPDRPLGPDGQPIKRGRGRPKGSKNKSTLARLRLEEQKAKA